MSVDTLLSRLEGVRKTGKGTWRARCPGHNSRGQTLAVRETDDGRVLLHCFAGCAVESVLSSVGLSVSDLFPERLEGHHHGPERRLFPTADALRAVAFECLVIVAAGAALLAGESIEVADRERVMLAMGRIQGALDAAGIHHG